MNPGWQVVDCTEVEGSIRYERGAITVWKDNVEAGRIPLKRLAIILIGTHCSVSGAVLAKLHEYDVSLIVCDWRKVPISALYPDAEHSRIGARQQAQAALSMPRKKSAWAAIVRAKIRGQAATLHSLKIDGYRRLQELAGRVRSGDVDNVEAQAARYYWYRFADSADFHRDPGGGVGDDLNSCLDYAYTVLRGHAMRAVAAAGLAGTLGLFHHGRSNNFCLADDLMEPFRPAIDFYVKSNLLGFDLSMPETKRSLVDACSSEFDKTGKTIPTALMDLAQQLGRYVEGDVTKLVVPSWAGPGNG